MYQIRPTFFTKPYTNLENDRICQMPSRFSRNTSIILIQSLTVFSLLKDAIYRLLSNRLKDHIMHALFFFLENVDLS